jgi:glycosyltransferase involved in cell wall biosynthesis
MKKISVVIPTYNEEDNAESICRATISIIEKNLPGYDYEIIFIDNDSTDSTRAIIARLCGENKKVKAIFNAKNFGYLRSPYYGLTQATGDCAVLMAADFQEPPDMIPKFVEKWEEGFKVVCAVKTASKENPIMYFLRSCYYKLIHSMSSVDQIEHYTGFGLYDASFVKVLRDLGDPMPYMRGIVAELGFRRCEVEFTQPKRKSGKSSSNFFKLYDVAMLGFTSYTKGGLRVATFGGFIIAGLSFLIGIGYLIAKLFHWNDFTAGMAPVVIAVFLIGGIQLAFLGFLGEYVMSINTRIMNRPLVVEEKRLNFDNRSAADSEPEKTEKSVTDPSK